MNPDEVISAVRRSEQAWCEQICKWESLDCGVAFSSTDFPSLAEGNQLRDAWLADADPEKVYEQVETYYRDHGLTCRLWAPASGQAVEPVEKLLTGKGWRRHELLAMGLATRDTGPEPEDTAIRILPARAMPRAYRQSLSDIRPGDEACVEAGIRRLDDANYEAFVAMVDREVAGRIGYLEVGDIARLADFCWAPKFADRGTGRALVAHFLRLTRRLLPRVIVACVSTEDELGRSMLEGCGFSSAGSSAQFQRPTG